MRRTPTATSSEASWRGTPAQGEEEEGQEQGTPAGPGRTGQTAPAVPWLIGIQRGRVALGGPQASRAGTPTQQPQRPQRVRQPPERLQAGDPRLFGEDSTSSSTASEEQPARARNRPVPESWASDHWEGPCADQWRYVSGAAFKPATSDEARSPSPRSPLRTRWDDPSEWGSGH